ncbi:hypothetical protein [Aquisphaera insulae]|uniref:hypothetical protein n=1 Tax=Aquisphaera insulae TaxID=2712864 RepID=UPI0013EAFC62|nr:hypothetical protein [Aquisphaera insulae]
MRAAVNGVEIIRHRHGTPAERVDLETRIAAGPLGMFRHRAGASEYKDIDLEVDPRQGLAASARTIP